MPTDEEKKSVVDEAKELVDDIDDLGDDMGVDFWDGWDIVTFIIEIILIIAGIILALETGGAGLLVSLLGFILMILDMIGKLGDHADTREEKRRIDDIEKRAKELERRLRDMGASSP